MPETSPAGRPPAGRPPAGRPGAELAVRLGLGVVGTAGVVWGVVEGVRTVDVGSWWHVVRWGAGAVLAHDLLIGPVSVLLGTLVLARLARPWRPPLRAALLAGGTSGALLLAVWQGAASRRNPTVLPHTLTSSVVGAVVGTLVVAAVVALAGRWQRRRADRER